MIHISNLRNSKLYIRFLIIIAPLFLLLAGRSDFNNTQQNPRELRIKAIAGLKYDIVRFAVKPGENLRIIFENTDDMAHNLVFTKPGKRETVVKAAQMMGGAGTANNYVPESEDVLLYTKVLEIEETAILEFTAPEEEGVYPYACTYPGHGFIMYGAMYVTTKPLPPLASDKNVPENQRSPEFLEKASSPHPYLITYPTIYRTFMPECSPAAIAVAMTETHAYCWDAAKCMLRYTWEGGFLDNTAHWKGNGNALAEILGKVYFKNNNQFPFSLVNTDSLLTPDFGGYKLDKEGFPTFLYSVEDIKFQEHILPIAGDKGIQIQYEITSITEPLFYMLPKDNKVSIEIDKGTKEGEYIKLMPEEAQAFTITVTSLNQ
ncbi:MAG: plastocyanin/azurin family copper-binding protein [Bacteroidota bacterium]